MATQAEKKKMWRQWANVAAVLLIVIVSVLGAALQYNNTTVSGVVSRYNPDFWFSGFTCVIMAVLTGIGLLAFMVYQLYSATIGDRAVRTVDVPLWFIAVFGTVWTFAFYYDIQWLALFSGIIVTAAAVHLYLELKIGTTHVGNKTYWLVHVPFILLTTKALFMIVTQFMCFCIRYGWVWWGVNQAEWTLIAMFVLTFVGACFMCRRPDMIFGICFAWLFFGVAIYQMGESMMLTIAAIAMGCFFSSITYSACHHRRVHHK